MSLDEASNLSTLSIQLNAWSYSLFEDYVTCQIGMDSNPGLGSTIVAVLICGDYLSLHFLLSICIPLK